MKASLSFLGGDYEPYRIFRKDLALHPAVIPMQDNLHFRTEASVDTVVVRAFLNDVEAASCFVWYGERYRRERNFWPLGSKDAKVVHIETDPVMRGKGVAPQLLAVVAVELQTMGFERLYARIWHNNLPSLRAFAKAGWVYEQFVLELSPFRSRRRIRIASRMS